MNALAGLMNPAAIGQGMQQSFQQGMEQRRQTETRNALAAYAQNPGAEGAAMIAQHDPMLGIQLGQYEQQRAAQQAQQAEMQRKQQQEQMGQFRQLLQAAGENPQQAFAAAQSMGLDTSKVPPPGSPQFDQWRQTQLFILDAAEKNPEMLTTTAKEVMLSLPPEHRNPDSPVFVEAMGRALEKMVSYQAGGGVAAINPATGKMRQIVQPGPSIAQPQRYNPNEWEDIEGDAGSNVGPNFLSGF